MQTLWQDLRYGTRILLTKPGFTIIALLTVALGIAASTSIFTVVDAVLLRPLPMKDPDRVVVVHNQLPKLNLPRTEVSALQYIDYSKETTAFASTALMTQRNFNLTGLNVPERVQAARVTASFFPLLGMNPLAGRFFREEEDKFGNERVAVLSFALCKRLFDSSTAILNNTIELNGERYLVIGIAPEQLQEIFPRSDLWVPMAFSQVELSEDRRGTLAYTMFARLPPNRTLLQAQTVMTGVARNIPGNKSGNFNIEVRSLADEYVSDVRKPLFVLLGAVIAVLLISCANVANLLLARASVRAHEIAVRVSLGAGRARIIRQLLTESILLSALGGALGIMLASWSTRTLLALAPDSLPRVTAVHLDLRVLLFSCLLSLACGVLFGMVPAVIASKTSLISSLKESERTDTAGSMRQRLRRMLVVTEVAMAFVLLICAGLLARSFGKLLDVRPGFDAKNILTARLSLPGTRYDGVKKVVAFYDELLPRIAALPGVTHVAAANQPPFMEPDNSIFSIRDRRANPNDPPTHADYAFVSSDYFKSIGLPILKGRDFQSTDMRAGDFFGSNSVAIVDEELAKRFWPNGDALGGGLSWSSTGPWATVVGVVATAQLKDLTEESKGTFYLPTYSGRSTLVVRTTGDPRTLTQAIRQQVQAVDGNQPIYDVKTMDQRVSATLDTRRFAVVLLGMFGGLAILLAAIGVYGVLAFAVAQRRREIGIRMALGAQARDVLQMVIKQGMSVVLWGVTLGFAGAYLLTRLMQSLLFGVTATDPLTFGGVSLLLSLVAVLACYIPARRATKVDPLVALRYE